ncbi:MAG: pyruvate formate lyase family protein [Phycisphaeraceae bacterium]
MNHATVDPDAASLVTSRLPLRQLADRLFTAADTVCLERANLVTEAWQHHEHEPRPVLRARVLEHVLGHMTLDLETNPIFAGNNSTRPRGWMLLPEYRLDGDGQVGIEHAELRNFLDDKIPPNITDAWRGRCAADLGLGATGGDGHLAVDLDAIVNRGLAAVVRDVEQRERSEATCPDQRIYLHAMRIALNAMINWAHRYADTADQAADAANDPQLAFWHRRVATACRQVPEYPARNLYEGLQAIALTQLALAIEGQALSVSVGLPDRALARFAGEAEREPDATADLVAAFLLKLAANAIFGKGSKTQAITVGGADHMGRDCCNAITLAFLEGFDRMPVADPHLFLRWHGRLDACVGDKACQMLSRGRSMPLLVHDAPTAAGLIDAGVAVADAWDYCVIGCNELGIPGRLFDSAVGLGNGFNDLAILNTLLLETSEAELDAIRGMDDLLERLEAAYEAHFRHLLPGRAERQRLTAALMPNPLTSALMRGGAARACDVMQNMPYRTPCIFTRGLANAVDAFAAIEQLVFRRGPYTLRALVEALRQNLDDATVRERLSDAPKWGNDDVRADRWAEALIALRRRAVERAEAACGLAKHVVCHVVRSLHHVDGRQIAASLDGRRAGSPVGDSIGALPGSATQGPTAMLASVLKVDAGRDFAGGYNLNLTLPPAQAAPQVIRALVEGFFDDGGQELQINVLDVAQLHAAREHPERHRDLVVRVAGLSARFIELSDVEQLELIARAEAVGEVDKPA